METIQQEATCRGIRISVRDKNSKEVGHAFLYIMENDLHNQPFGLMENVYIDETARKKGLGTSLVQNIIQLAKDNNCYKLIATSRYGQLKVHRLYENIGFQMHGVEFRITF